MALALPRWLVKANYAIQHDRATREVFYRVLQKQLSIGQSLETSVLRMGESMATNAMAKNVGKVTQKNVGTGGLLTAKWDDAGLLREYDAQLLKVGETQGTLRDVLTELTLVGEEPVSIFHRLLKPGLYPYIFMLGVAVIANVLAKTIYEDFAGDFADIPARQTGYQISLFLRAWLPVIAGSLATTCFIYMTACQWVTGRWRQRLRLLFADHDRQTASRFLFINQLLARQGVSPERIVEVSIRLMNSVHARHTLRVIAERLRFGDDYFLALRDRILVAWAANMLGGLAPGGDRQLLSDAFEVVRVTLDEKAKATYAKISVGFNLIVMASAVVLIYFTIFGIYDTVMEMTDRMQHDF